MVLYARDSPAPPLPLEARRGLMLFSRDTKTIIIIMVNRENEASVKSGFQLPNSLIIYDVMNTRSGIFVCILGNWGPSIMGVAQVSKY